MKPIYANGIAAIYNKIFKKQANIGLSVADRDPDNTTSDQVDFSMPVRSGNQNTPMKPRHQEFFNAPVPGASLDSKQTVGGNAKRNQRPVPMKFGNPGIVPTVNNDLLSTFNTSPVTTFT